MTSARYLIGDVFDRMAELPDASVDLIMCSPPFLALRSYLPADHPDKHKEIGSEPTPAAFVDTLLALTSEWRRLLAPHGSICIELGDTYSGSGGSGGDYNPGGLREGQQVFTGSGNAARRSAQDEGCDMGADCSCGYEEFAQQMRDSNAAHWRAKNAHKHEWPLAKSLCLIPELYRIGLVYGLNPLTGDRSPAGRWRARNVVRWHRPNPPVGALGDKFRPATSDMVIACISPKRNFDLDAVREPGKHPDDNRAARAGNSETYSRNDDGLPRRDDNPAGAPPLDTWTIPTEPYKGAHYATWPRDLCTKPILAMSPQHVCLECGAPRRRVVEQTGEYAEHRARARAVGDGQFNADNAMWVGGKSRPTARGGERVDAQYATVGWSDCGHDNYRRGLVLDPFAGTGTTLVVATGHGRDAIGIDIDPRNLDLARERIGMFLEADE